MDQTREPAYPDAIDIYVAMPQLLCNNCCYHFKQDLKQSRRDIIANLLVAKTLNKLQFVEKVPGWEKTLWLTRVSDMIVHYDSTRIPSVAILVPN